MSFLINYYNIYKDIMRIIQFIIINQTLFIISNSFLKILFLNAKKDSYF